MLAVKIIFCILICLPLVYLLYILFGRMMDIVLKGK